MDKAIFLRKCSDYKNYDQELEIFKNVLGEELFVDIIKTVKLSKSDYNHFINNFLYDYDFIRSVKDELVIYDYNTVKCIFVTNNGIDGFLVYSSGFSYARYVARYSKGGDKCD